MSDDYQFGEAVPLRFRDGRAFLLRPSMAALIAIEDKTDHSIASLYALHAAGALKIRELAVIVTEGMRAELGADGAMPADVAEYLFELGLASEALRVAVARLLLSLAWSPEDAGKKYKVDWAISIALARSVDGLADTLPAGERAATQ